MRTAFVLFFVTIMGASAWAKQPLPTKAAVHQAVLEVSLQNQTNATVQEEPPKVALLYLEKNWRIKRALKFAMKRRHPRWA